MYSSSKRHRFSFAGRVSCNLRWNCNTEHSVLFWSESVILLNCCSYTLDFFRRHGTASRCTYSLKCMCAAVSDKRCVNCYMNIGEHDPCDDPVNPSDDDEQTSGGSGVYIGGRWGSGVAIIAAGDTDLYCHSEPPLTSGKLCFIINFNGGTGGPKFLLGGGPLAPPLNRLWPVRHLGFHQKWMFTLFRGLRGLTVHPCTKFQQNPTIRD